MGKILDFFGSVRPPDEPTATFEELQKRVRAFCSPALRLSKTTVSAKSYLGGQPALPDSIARPSKNDKPLEFLASIDLEEVAATGVVPWLPDTGRLLFFYDIDEQPWGFDPDDRGSWAVIHVTDSPHDSLDQREALPKLPVRFEKFDSVPSWERASSLGMEMSETDGNVFYDGLYELDEDQEEHQISGFPNVMQGDGMELESQLASNGINVGDATGYESAEARQLESGADDWRLLLQISSDDDLDVMFGDCGLIYFWVKEQDAIRGDFSNVWLILQCG